MKTPICDFVKKYAENNLLRLHMPGHKGKSFLGFENYDITEVDGADCLSLSNGIIKESELNASEIFGAKTFYSTEGSSLCVRAMIFLCYKYAKLLGKKPLILAGRNAHKSFLSAVSLLDFDVAWLYGSDSYLSCDINASKLKECLLNMETLPVALYITNPDYLGNTVDIKSISTVCKEFNVLLIVDNAHGAYLKFLPNSLHPIDLGADMCCDSAHKTLPALTGASYLHISKNTNKFFSENVKNALSLFSTTSPSYLTLQSLDMLNRYLIDSYKEQLENIVEKIKILKTNLSLYGYTLLGNEPLKLCINVKPFGYNGFEFNDMLKDNGAICEYYDQDYIVFMLTPETEESGIFRLEKILKSIKKTTPIMYLPPKVVKPKTAMNIRQALMSTSQTIEIHNSLGKIASCLAVNCPPAVPIIVSGEIIDEKVISVLDYYGINTIEVVK